MAVRKGRRADGLTQDGVGRRGCESDACQLSGRERLLQHVGDFVRQQGLIAERGGGAEMNPAVLGEGARLQQRRSLCGGGTRDDADTRKIKAAARLEVMSQRGG